MSITTTLRPNGTLRAVKQTVTGATTVSDATSDNSDSTYSSGPPTGFAKVSFPGYSFPTGAVVKGLVIRLRMEAAGPGNRVTTLLNGESTGPFPFFPDETIRTDSSFGISGISTQAVANGLTLQWTNNGSWNVAVFAAYLDIEAIERPTVTVLAPSSAPAVTNPEIDWEFDGDYSQAAFQVKIFSQAQYQASGFNATTSAAVYDSGIVSGSDDSLVPATTLTNGTRYRFYVRGAQITDAGDYQWSTWSFVEQTITAAVPPVPGIAVAVDNTLARIKLTLTDVFTPPAQGYGFGPYGSGPYGGTGATGGASAGQTSWQFVTVQRSSNGGLTWDAVRSANHAQVFGDTFEVFDYEACNSVDVVYRAQAIATFGTGEVTSNWSTPTNPVHWSSDLVWLKSPTFPAANTTVRIGSLPTLTRRQPQGTFDIEGRADPVVIADTRKLPTGTVTFQTLELSERDALLLLLNRSEPLLLQMPPANDFGCRYLAIGDVDETRNVDIATLTERLIVCPFQQVLAPAGEIVGSGGSGGSATYQTLIDRYASYSDLDGLASYEAVLELT